MKVKHTLNCRTKQPLRKLITTVIPNICPCLTRSLSLCRHSAASGQAGQWGQARYVRRGEAAWVGERRSCGRLDAGVEARRRGPGTQETLGAWRLGFFWLPSLKESGWRRRDGRQGCQGCTIHSKEALARTDDEIQHNYFLRKITPDENKSQFQMTKQPILNF